MENYDLTEFEKTIVDLTRQLDSQKKQMLVSIVDALINGRKIIIQHKYGNQR